MSPQIPNPKAQIPNGVWAAALLLAAAVVYSPARAQDARPLPPPGVLYRAVKENLARAERVAYLYSFRERRTDVHANPFGRIGTGGTRMFEVYPSANRQLRYRRLVERNGAPVDSKELAEQDRQYRARVADVQRRLGTQSAEDERRRDAEAAQARERGQRRVDDALDALQFTVEGRTVYEGAPAFVVSFAPRPGATPTSREGRTAQRFAGRVWIHEAAAEVMRVEARSVDALSFGYGLVARLGPGTEATLTRRPIAGDLWMPTELTLKGRGRAALLRTLVIDFAVDWFDYRRLEADLGAPFPDARVQRQPGGGPQ